MSIPSITAITGGHPPQSPSKDEVRASVRFPIRLPVVIEVGDERLDAETENISASGLLFHLQKILAPGTPIGFTIAMPGKVLGTERDVLVRCSGRVVRSTEKTGDFIAAAVIDEYHLESALETHDVKLED